MSRCPTEICDGPAVVELTCGHALCADCWSACADPVCLVCGTPDVAAVVSKPSEDASGASSALRAMISHKRQLITTSAALAMDKLVLQQQRALQDIGQAMDVLREHAKDVDDTLEKAKRELAKLSEADLDVLDVTEGQLGAVTTLTRAKHLEKTLRRLRTAYDVLEIKSPSFKLYTFTKRPEICDFCVKYTGGDVYVFGQPVQLTFSVEGHVNLDASDVFVHLLDAEFSVNVGNFPSRVVVELVTHPRRVVYFCGRFELMVFGIPAAEHFAIPRHFTLWPSFQELPRRGRCWPFMSDHAHRKFVESLWNLRAVVSEDGALLMYAAASDSHTTEMAVCSTTELDRAVKKLSCFVGAFINIARTARGTVLLHSARMGDCQAKIVEFDWDLNVLHEFIEPRLFYGSVFGSCFGVHDAEVFGKLDDRIVKVSLSDPDKPAAPIVGIPFDTTTRFLSISPDGSRMCTNKHFYTYQDGVATQPHAFSSPSRGVAWLSDDVCLRGRCLLAFRDGEVFTKDGVCQVEQDVQVADTRNRILYCINQHHEITAFSY